MAQFIPTSSICRACRDRLTATTTILAHRIPRTSIRNQRGFATSTSKPAEDDVASQAFSDALRNTRPRTQADRPAPPPRPISGSTPSPRSQFQSQPQSSTFSPLPAISNTVQHLISTANAEATTKPSSRIAADEPYHLNIYAHKHNMHITFTEPSRNPILSFSAGSLGLRKAQRSSYDAAYQLSTYTMRKLAEKQWRSGGKKMTMNKMNTLKDVKKIEVVLRGFGPGREAFTKALLGVEGRLIKHLVTKVTDSTRLKFGGARSPQVRRLG